MGMTMASLRSAHPNEAFAEFVKNVQPTATKICRRYRIPPQDAEDLMQQTLIALIDSRDDVQNPEAWIAGTLRNQCLMYWRRRRRRLYNAVDSAILEEMAAPSPPQQQSVEFSHDLERALGQLPNRCRSVLQLRYGLGCQPRETAERLGYRSSSIYKILNRCLAALSRSLAVREPPPGRAGEGKVASQCQFANPE